MIGRYVRYPQGNYTLANWLEIARKHLLQKDFPLCNWVDDWSRYFHNKEEPTKDPFKIWICPTLSKVKKLETGQELLISFSKMMGTATFGLEIVRSVHVKEGGRWQ